MPQIVLNSNIAALNAQRRLGESTARLGASFERISSGLRINRASDDAAGLAVAAGLDIDRRVYAQGVKNLHDGISYLSIAEGATTALSDVLMRMRELSTQSSNGTLSGTQRWALDGEFQALIGEYNRIVGTTSFNGRRVFDPSDPTVVLQSGYGAAGQLVADLHVATALVGDGTFQPRQSFPVGLSPTSLITVDIDGDGKLDAVATNQAVGNAEVLLGNGDGTFHLRQSFAVGSVPTSIAAAELNGDGRVDLVAGNSGSHTLSILIGNGNGTFQAQQTYASGGNNTGFAFADYNGDGKPDLVAVDSTSPSRLFLGNGDGTFAAAQNIDIGIDSITVATGDLNGDGRMDLVTKEYANGRIRVTVGNGNGTFQAPVSYNAGLDSAFPAVCIADLDGDGVLDIVGADLGDNTVSILLGNGDGTFQPRQAFATGSQPWSVEVRDLNGDGVPDLLTADSNDDTLSILLGNGDGTFRSRTTVATGDAPRSVSVGDFNGDGVPDLASATFAGFTLDIFLGNPVTRPVSRKPIGSLDVLTRNDALAAQGTIDSYLQQLNAFSAAIGASLSRLETAARTAGLAAANFRDAGSRIVDADLAEEAANLVKNRILQLAGAAVLTQANQTPALALTLLAQR